MTKDLKITFTVEPKLKTLISDLYYPVPAIKEIPDWYKNMQSSMDISTANAAAHSKTIKRCMPVFDAMTAGYLIKTWTDIEFIKDENNNLQWDWALGLPEKIAPVESHGGYQLINYKDIPNIQGAPKFINAFGISTPKGYSCLFINPPHRPDWGGRILEGFVDTDMYSASVNFPFLMHDVPKVIPAGTPVAMVIPFKRESWQMEIGNEESGLKMLNDAISVMTKFVHGYKSIYRQKKEYK